MVGSSTFAPLGMARSQRPVCANFMQIYAWIVAVAMAAFRCWVAAAIVVAPQLEAVQEPQRPHGAEGVDVRGETQAQAAVIEEVPAALLGEALLNRRPEGARTVH